MKPLIPSGYTIKNCILGANDNGYVSGCRFILVNSSNSERIINFNVSKLSTKIIAESVGGTDLQTNIQAKWKGNDDGGKSFGFSSTWLVNFNAYFTKNQLEEAMKDKYSVVSFMFDTTFKFGWYLTSANNKNNYTLVSGYQLTMTNEWSKASSLVIMNAKYKS